MHKSYPRRRVLAAACGLLAAPAIVRAQGTNGVALVIGNSKYRWEASLPNVKRDAPDVAKRFQALGLKTELIQDAGRDAMLQAIEKFGEASRGAKLAAFYFAGHGVTWERQSFIVPVDADLSDPSKLLDLVRLPSVITASKEAGARLLVFDSCRNNPADGWRQRQARLAARVDPGDQIADKMNGRDTLTLFSTASGAVALDGPAGANSPFAVAFMRQLDAPSIDLQTLPAQLRRDLLLATNGRQMLWDQNTFTSPYPLKGPGKSAAAWPPVYQPSTVLELPKAYAFAQQNGLPLPSGLVALRTASDEPGARMIGSYKWELMVATSPAATSFFLSPALGIVLAVPDEKTVVSVGTNKNWEVSSGTHWRFGIANRTKNGYVASTADGRQQFEFSWHDQNSGTLTNSGGGSIPKSRPFTRLD